MSLNNVKENVYVVFDMFEMLDIFDFSLWGCGTRLWRPKEPGGDRFPKEPGARAGPDKSPLLWDTVRTPYRQSLIGEKSVLYLVECVCVCVCKLRYEWHSVRSRLPCL